MDEYWKMSEASSTTLPPGIYGNFKHITSDGEDADWMPSKEGRYYTNAFIVHNGKLLLGYKKKGFGKHKYNGFGGKVESGETPLQAAIRELEEEAGITAPLEYAGYLLFLCEGIDQAFHIDVFRADEYSGVITETDEMRPQWFSLSSLDTAHGAMAQSPDMPDIPFDDMWEDDRYWMPFLLSKQTFSGRADFKQDGEVFKMLKWWFGVISE